MTLPLRLIVFAAVLFATDGNADVAKNTDLPGGNQSDTSTSGLENVAKEPMISEPRGKEPRTVRIGVYVRDGFDACLRSWLPTAEHLTSTIQGYDFIFVPLASREDIYDYLQKKKIDFLISNAAIHVCAEERYGISALAGMTSTVDPTGHECTGTLIRRADRTDLTRMEDIAGVRLSAVKPWSFGGWIMQRRALQLHGVDPLRRGTAVEFQGTHEEVIQAVLDGRADVGAVATDLLEQRIESGSLDPNELFVFNRDGDAVPLGREAIPSTEGYPDWVFAKAATTGDSLAKRILQSLLFRDRNPHTDSTDRSNTWTVPQNCERVRRTLRELVGPDYAYADGTKLVVSPLFSHVVVGAVVVGALTLAGILFFAWRRARQRDLRDREDIETIHSELNEVRAGKHLLETILTKVHCGIDIVDENDNVVYVAPAIEQRYGAWHGKKCHEYYRNSPTPCEHCTKRNAASARRIGGAHGNSCATLQVDPHPIGESSSNGTYGKLLQVPFFDETGRWLYARVHLPPEVSEEGIESEGMTARPG